VEEIEGDKGVIIRVALLPMAKDAPGMKGYRSRNEDGQLREKRGDTHIGTIERQYSVDFRVRDDMHLDTLLEQRGISSLNDLLHGK
jgi:hypothetical protein